MNYTIRWIRYSLILFFLVSRDSRAEYHLIEPEQLDLRFSRFVENRDPLTPDIPQEAYRGRTSLDWSLRLAHYGYWISDIHTESTASQLQTVGWHYEIGVRLLPYLSPFYEHHSRHRLDSVYPGDQQYPVEDSYGIRIHLLPYRGDSLLGGR